MRDLQSPIFLALGAILLLSLVGLFYTYVGYPLLVRLLRRVVTRPVRKDDVLPTVSFIIAARNEEQAIKEKLRNTLALDYPADRLEIVVASDGSTDGTDAVVRQFADRVRLFSSSEHLGKTETANRVVPKTTGEILVYSDATGEYGREALRALVRSFADPEVGAVTGRVLYRYGKTATSDSFRRYQRYVVAARRAESAFGTKTSVSGSICALRRTLFTAAPSDLDYDMVHPLHVAMANRRTVYEAEAISTEESRLKIGDEFAARQRIAIQAYTFLPYLFRRLPRCRYRIYVFQVLSHKVLRWLSPHLLLAALLSSLALGLVSPWFWSVALAEAAIGLAALAAWVAERFGRRIPGLSLSLLFSAVNLAFLIGFWKWLRGERRGAWTPVR